MSRDTPHTARATATTARPSEPTTRRGLEAADGEAGSQHNAAAAGLRQVRLIVSELAAARARMGISAHEMATYFGLNKDTIAAYERGDRQPPTLMLLRWMGALGFMMLLCGPREHPCGLAVVPTQTTSATADHERLVVFLLDQCAARGLTISQLAILIDATPRSIRRWRSRRSINRPSHLFTLATVVEIQAHVVRRASTTWLRGQPTTYTEFD
jgi:transcriptional regulator with XRE-family HTH domain